MDEGGLAGAGLADEGHELPRSDVQGRVADGGGPAPSGAVLDREVPEVEQRVGHRRGSFLSEVEMRCAAITTSASAMPGRIEIHGWTAT
nr:hypothetical protein GCM10025732_44500 [Glycomyces mayteni]